MQTRKGTYVLGGKPPSPLAVEWYTLARQDHASSGVELSLRLHVLREGPHLFSEDPL